MAWTAPNKTWVTGEIVDATDMNTYIRDQFEAVLPVGTLILRVANYATVETAVESRWLLCNGVAVSRTTYSVLFNYLNGLTPALPFGVGNGTTTFNIPDLRGRVPVGEGEHGDVDQMGDSDGTAIAVRSPKHFHQTQVGSASVGGTVPRTDNFDSVVAFNYPTTGGSGTNPQDNPAFLVFGSYFIKFTA